MIYEVQSKSDLLTGASLTVTIPEEELDKKALYTILSDKPGYILPFRYRNIEGLVEFVYQTGSCSKLQHLSGSRTPKEYARLWSGILSPLLDCGDWFMKPYSFMLSLANVYCDKSCEAVSYIYIPSVRDCCGYEDLKEMAADISKLISVADSDLENKVLRAIMKDFNPKGFLQMLKSYVSESAAPEKNQCSKDQYHGGYSETGVSPGETRVSRGETHTQQYENVTAPVSSAGQEEPRLKKSVLTPFQDKMKNNPGDIVINIPINGTQGRRKNAVKKNVESSEAGDIRQAKKVRLTGGFFGKKKEERTELSSKSLQGSDLHENQHIEHFPLPAQGNIMTADFPDETVFFQEKSSAIGFRLVGNVLLPPLIEVPITQGEVFTIGRYDAAAGRKQSDFEFDKKTKAVSRRHTAIERGSDGYSIVDLSSSAGTFLNGQKLPANTPFELGHGTRVSFGNAGADYVWEM